MLNWIRFLLISISQEQETGVNSLQVENTKEVETTNLQIHSSNKTMTTMLTEIKTNAPVLIENAKSVLQELGQRVHDGLTLADIENILLLILFIRFIILAIRYNIKTSLYITCIGLFAGYLWYRHLIDFISLYRNVLLGIPYFYKLGMDAVELRNITSQMLLTDLKLGDKVHWYNPGQLIYYAFTNGIVKLDKESGLYYYIDPISMAISNWNDIDKSKILPIYYKIYNQVIPALFESVGQLWTQLSGIAGYALITRIGKRYCPYLVRWHWTFLLILAFFEQIVIYFVFRISYFQINVLIPQIQYASYLDRNILLEINFLNGLTAFIIFSHFGFIIFGMFHAIWGQYFYFPFLVENTELHIGPRPKNSIYSGGKTAWQDEKQKQSQRVLPKFWYGFFGSGTKENWNTLVKTIKKIVETIKKILQKTVEIIKKIVRWISFN